MKTLVRTVAALSHPAVCNSFLLRLPRCASEAEAKHSISGDKSIDHAHTHTHTEELQTNVRRAQFVATSNDGIAAIGLNRSPIFYKCQIRSFICLSLVLTSTYSDNDGRWEIDSELNYTHTHTRNDELDEIPTSQLTDVDE